MRSSQTMIRLTCSTAVMAALLAGTARAQDLVHAKDGSGTYGYRDTPVLPWCGYKVHDPDRPVPPRVEVPTAGEKSAPPPSDAVVLFDGKDLAQWRPTRWKIEDGCIVAGAGGVQTVQEFGDCQIHVEWMAPAGFQGPWYNRGNSGVMLMGRYEIQVFDSWNEKIYPDGMAGAIYGQTPPLVNPCRKPGEWQSFDIFFTAPVFKDGKLETPGRVTMLFNGVLVHLSEEIRGEVGHRVLPVYRATTSMGPLMLSGHDCPVRFRNIWVRPLIPPKAPTTRPS